MTASPTQGTSQIEEETRRILMPHETNVIMTEAALDKLLELESELKANLASPRPDTLAFLDDALAPPRNSIFN